MTEPRYTDNSKEHDNLFRAWLFRPAAFPARPGGPSVLFDWEILATAGWHTASAEVLRSQPLEHTEEPQRRWTDVAAQAAAQFFAGQVRDLPTVEAVFMSTRENTLTFHTVIAAPDDGLQEAISEAELATMDEFDDLLFDWRVIFRGELPLPAVRPPDAVSLV